MADLTEEQRARRRKAAKARRERNKSASQAQVVELFGAPGGRDDPDNILPAGKDNREMPRGRKTSPRKKVRLSPNMTELMDSIKQGRTTMAEVVEAMDPEELVRGQFKAQDGTFKGRRPAYLPADFHNACIRELLKRGQDLYRSNFIVAIEAFTAIAADKTVEPAQRLKAAQYIWERVEGKVPDRVEIAAAEPWQQIIDGIVAEAEDNQIARASRVLSGEE